MAVPEYPFNAFKKALHDRKPQIGYWMSLASPCAAEICAGAGFDWLLVDGEHAPNSLESLLHQLQLIGGYPATHAVARVPTGEGALATVLIKQYLDLGFQTLLVPMVDSAAQAAELVRAMRYPPEGVRGIGGSRAARWGRIPNYAARANDQVCLLVQAETRRALSNLEEIAATPGVDGVFIGPADLAADLGHVGQIGHPEVQSAIDDALRRIGSSGKPAGILYADESLAAHALDIGATFIAIGQDSNLLMRGTAAAVARFKPAPQAS